MNAIKAISTLLCTCLLTQNLQAQVPPPRMIELSPEQMNKLLIDPTIKRTHILLTQDISPAEAAKKEAEKKEEEEEQKKVETPPTHSDPGIDFFSWIDLGGSSDSTGMALVVFAVVGLVIVVAWIPYFPILLYQAATGKREIEKSHQFSFQQVMTGKNGSFSGARYSLYLKDPKEVDSMATLGFSTEMGYYNFKDTTESTTIKVEGGYWLLGPSMLFGASDGEGFPLFARIDLLAGSSFDADLGLVSRADLTVGSYLFGSNTTIGLGLGALYLHNKRNQGLLNNGQELDLIFAASAGYSF